jgi:hypothetical protein
MVGDLLEIEKEKGKLWFWLSVTGVALSLLWRRPLAFVAALYAGSWTLSWFEMATIGVNTLHRPPEYPWMPVFNVLILVGSTLCGVSLYAVIRYGVQERISQIAIVWTALVASVIYFWWQPIVLTLFIGAALCLVVASMWTSKRRMESMVVLVAVAIGCAARFLFMIPAALYQRFLYRGPWGDKEVREHPSFSWMTFCMIILSFWVATWAWSRMRGWLMRNQSLESRSEML